MKALTVRQPWAWAIAEGYKTIENRSRGTSYRGPLAIHAGLSWSERGATDPRVVEQWRSRLYPVVDGAVTSTPLALTPAGAILAVADLVDSHPDAGCCRPWGESSYVEGTGRTVGTVHHLVLENATRLERPIACPGALGLWTAPTDPWLTAAAEKASTR